MIWKNFLRLISEFFEYSGVYSVLEIMRRMAKGWQRVGNGEELFYSDKDVLKKVKNFHVCRVAYIKLYISVSWVNLKSAWNDDDLRNLRGIYM